MKLAKNSYQSLEVSQPQMAVPESLALSVRLLQSSEAPFLNTSFAAGLLVAPLVTLVTPGQKIPQTTNTGQGRRHYFNRKVEFPRRGYKEEPPIVKKSNVDK